MSANKLIVLLISVMSVMLYGCAENVSIGNANGPVDLKFNLHADSTYRYTVNNNIALTQQIDKENTITINQNMSLMTTYRVVAADPSEKTISVTYDRITMSSGNQLFSLDYDSENDNGTDPMYEGLRNLIDRTYKIVVTDRGVVQSSEQIRRQATYNNAIYGFNDSSLRKVMLHCLSIYPDSVVNVGDIWERTYATSIGFADVTVRNRYQLVSLDKGIAHIVMQGRVNTDNTVNDENSVMLKGVESGEFDLIIKNGLVKNGKVSQKLSGNMDITGAMTPVDVESDIYIMGVTKTVNSNKH